MQNLIKEAQLELTAEEQVNLIIIKLANQQKQEPTPTWRSYLAKGIGGGALTTAFLLGTSSSWLPFGGHNSLSKRLGIALALGAGVGGAAALQSYLSRKIEQKPT